MATEPIRAIPSSNDRQKQTKTQHTDYTLVATWREMARPDDLETVEFQHPGMDLPSVIAFLSIASHCERFGRANRSPGAAEQSRPSSKSERVIHEDFDIAPCDWLLGRSDSSNQYGNGVCCALNHHNRHRKWNSACFVFNPTCWLLRPPLRLRPWLPLRLWLRPSLLWSSTLLQALQLLSWILLRLSRLLPPI